MQDSASPYLFRDIPPDSYLQMLQCLQATKKHFNPNETVCRFGENFQSVGMIASGSASIIRYETSGTRTILEQLNKHDIFGEILAFHSPEYESIYVVCDKECEIIFLDYQHIIRPCFRVCSHHHQLIQNMLFLISSKVFHFSQRIELLSKRSIRDKLICFFYQLTSKSRSRQADIPFTMSNLADYLCVDRSAMTRELKKMKEEGIIELDKYRVTLNKIY